MYMYILDVQGRLRECFLLFLGVCVYPVGLPLFHSRSRLFENLRLVPHVPSVQMQGGCGTLYSTRFHSHVSIPIPVDIPEDGLTEPEPAEDNPNERMSREY